MVPLRSVQLRHEAILILGLLILGLALLLAKKYWNAQNASPGSLRAVRPKLNKFSARAPNWSPASRVVGAAL
jgi:hypothetical protein